MGLTLNFIRPNGIDKLAKNREHKLNVKAQVQLTFSLG
jgi:hypothetical protein